MRLPCQLVCWHSLQNAPSGFAKSVEFIGRIAAARLLLFLPFRSRFRARMDVAPALCHPTAMFVLDQPERAVAELDHRAARLLAEQILDIAGDRVRHE